MDNYPKHLSPDFDESGAITSNFVRWWALNQQHFKHVPEEVARHWLFEHWDHSPYQWLKSANYDFHKTNWPSKNLQQIRSTWDDFANDNHGCLHHGKYLAGLDFYQTAKFMIENQQVPAGIIVIDNRDSHLKKDYPDSYLAQDLPSTFVLIEGHRRFNLALYLESIHSMEDHIKTWLMVRR